MGEVMRFALGLGGAAGLLGTTALVAVGTAEWAVQSALLRLEASAAPPQLSPVGLSKVPQVAPLDTSSLFPRAAVEHWLGLEPHPTTPELGMTAGGAHDDLYCNASTSTSTVFSSTAAELLGGSSPSPSFTAAKAGHRRSGSRARGAAPGPTNHLSLLRSALSDLEGEMADTLPANFTLSDSLVSHGALAVVGDFLAAAEEGSLGNVLDTLNDVCVPNVRFSDMSFGSLAACKGGDKVGEGTAQLAETMQRTWKLPSRHALSEVAIEGSKVMVYFLGSLAGERAEDNGRLLIFHLNQEQRIAHVATCCA